MLLGVDVGGTFTDAVLAVDGAIFTAKAPTTPSDQSQGVIAAVEAVLGLARVRADEIEDQRAHATAGGLAGLHDRPVF